MATFLRPDADDTDGAWTNETGGTSLFASVDDTSANDADYIQSSDDPASDICRLRLSNPATALAPPGTVRVRYKRSGTGSVDLTVRLKQGTTEIASWVLPDIPATFTTSEQTLTTDQYAAITDFNNLFVELQADAESEWPDASSTGVPEGTVLTAYSGPAVIATDGVLIENKIIEDVIEITANNVTIRNCRIQNSFIHGLYGDGLNATIEHCDLIGSGGSNVSTGILLAGTFTANDISGYALGMSLTGPSTVRDNYIHDLQKDAVDTHFDGIAIFGGGDALIEHNAIYMPLDGATACIFLKNFFGPIDNVTINNNLLRGPTPYTIALADPGGAGPITNVTVVNNVMQSGQFGYFVVDVPALSSNITGSGNVDYLTGDDVPFPDTGVPPVVGPISFGSAGTFLSYAGRTNSTLVAPASIADGDLLIAYLVIGGSTNPATPTPPAGWSTLPGSPISVNDGGFFVKNCVFYKIASGESGDYLFTTAAGNSTCGVICRYSGVDTASPFSPTPTTNSGTGTIATALGFTTTVTNTFLIFTEQDWGTNVNNLVPPSGSVPVYTERVEQPIIYIADGTVGAPRATGNQAHASHNNDGEKWSAYLIGLKPSS